MASEGGDDFMSENGQTAIIAANAVSKRVTSPEGELVILDTVSLAVDEGETVAIVGASGSGKSTLLGLLAGLDDPSSGTIRLADAEIGSLNEDGRARLRAERVGFVFQSFQLLISLTALENVSLPLELAGKSDATERARQVLGQVGLAERTGHYPSQLSGGEQQRVAIARAFASNPSVLFADEPTGNLDQKTGSRVIELLFSLNRAHGTTLVLVTHDVGLAELCDRRLHLEGGRLVNGEDNE